MTRSSTAPYRERLWPRWWLWSLPLSLAALLAIAYGSAYGPLTGWIILAIGVPAVLGFVIALSPVVMVDDVAMTAGRARLPLAAVRAVAVLDRDRLVAVRRTGDARAFTLLRPWTGPDAVEIRLDDPDDPHPAWLVTSRDPARLAAAVSRHLPPVLDAAE